MCSKHGWHHTFLAVFELMKFKWHKDAFLCLFFLFVCFLFFSFSSFFFFFLSFFSFFLPSVLPSFYPSFLPSSSSERDRQTDRQTETETERHRERQRDTERHRETERRELLVSLNSASHLIRRSIMCCLWHLVVYQRKDGILLTHLFTLWLVS